MDKSNKEKLAVAKILATFPNTPRRFDAPSSSCEKTENRVKSKSKKATSPPKTKNRKKKSTMNKVENTSKSKIEKQKRTTRAKGAKDASGVQNKYNTQPHRQISLNGEAMPSPPRKLEPQGLLEKSLRRPEGTDCNYIKQVIMVNDVEHDNLVLTQEEMEMRKVADPILAPLSNPDFNQLNYETQNSLLDKTSLCAEDQKDNNKSFLSDDQMEKTFILSGDIHIPPTPSSSAVSVCSDSQSDDMCEDFLGFSSDEQLKINFFDIPIRFL